MKMRFFIVVICIFFIPILNVYPQFTPKFDGHYIQYRYDETLSQDYSLSYRFRAQNIIECIRVQYIDYEPEIRTTKIGTFSIVYSHEVPFLNIRWNDNTTERLLMLICDDFISLYDSNSEPIFWGRYYSREFHEYDVNVFGNSDTEWSSTSIETIKNVKASSTLVEGNIRYPATPERLGLHINRVWAVEGGIGERLYIMPYRFDSLYISTGYVNYSRPNLFQENSRPKRIRIIGAYFGHDFYMVDKPKIYENYFEVELEDTPNYQIINFPNQGNYQHYIIEITEIYHGTRFNHTSINSIMLKIYEGP